MCVVICICFNALAVGWESSGGLGVTPSCQPGRQSRVTVHQWSDLSVQKVIEAVHEGKMSINRAGMEHCVPQQL